MIAGCCQLEFEGCKRDTPVMFEVAPFGRGKPLRACSACWRALVGGAKPKPEAPRKNTTRLPSVPSKQRSMVK